MFKTAYKHTYTLKKQLVLVFKDMVSILRQQRQPRTTKERHLGQGGAPGILKFLFSGKLGSVQCYEINHTSTSKESLRRKIYPIKVIVLKPVLPTSYYLTFCYTTIIFPVLYLSSIGHQTNLFPCSALE